MTLLNDMRPVPRTSTAPERFEIVLTEQTVAYDDNRVEVETPVPEAGQEPLGAAIVSGEGPVLPPVNKPTSEPPVRLNGTIRQWSGLVGSVEPDDSSALLLVGMADIADGLEVVIGSRVSFLRDGRNAVQVWEAQEETE